MDNLSFTDPPFTVSGSTDSFFSNNVVSSTAHTVSPHLHRTTSPPSTPLRHPSLAEPYPSWNHALEVYGLAWQIHIYGLGSLFALVAFYCFICIIQLYRLPYTRPIRCYFCLIHLLLFLLGSSRAVFLLTDPYNYQNLFPQAVAAAFLHFSFPCLISAFCMVLAALIRTTELKLMQARIINGYVLMGLILGNFAFAITAEVLVDVFLTTVSRIGALAVASQTYFIAWSLGLGVGYLFMFGNLLSAAQSADGLETGARRIALGVQIILLAAVLLLVFAGLHVFGLISVYGFLTRPADIDPWTWYGFHVGTRITELFLAALLALVASLTVWSRAARRTSVTTRHLAAATASASENPEKRQQLLTQSGVHLKSSIHNNPPASPGIVPKNRLRDFPVTFNPDGAKGDEDLFSQPRFVNRQRNSTGRKPDSHLLETNPIHNDQDRYG